MVGLRLLYRFVGGLWLFMGVLIMIVAAGYLIAVKLMSNYLISQTPSALVSIINPLLRINAPGLEQIAGLVFSLFCIAIGVGLVTLRGWARTIGVAYHFIIGFALVILSVMVYEEMTSPIFRLLIPITWPRSVLILGLVISLGMFVFGFQLGTHSAIETFSGHVPTPPPMPPVKCPTCGGLLDLEKARCPKCDAELEQPSAPSRAKLVSLASGQEYPVSTRRQTRIGRDTPGLEILIDDPTISAEHAMIEYVDGHFYLHARKDTNGTFVNELDHRIRDIEIRNDDKIVFGRAQFQFVVE